MFRPKEMVLGIGYSVSINARVARPLIAEVPWLVVSGLSPGVFGDHKGLLYADVCSQAY